LPYDGWSLCHTNIFHKKDGYEKKKWKNVSHNAEVLKFTGTTNRVLYLKKDHGNATALP
jgi:hypothetical protein